MSPFVPRRTTLVSALLAAGGLLLGSRASTSSSAKGPDLPDTANFAFGRTDETDLSADDASLPPRLRALIRIGHDGIARENRAAVEAFFHPDYRFHGPDGSSIDRTALWAYFANCRDAFDDFSVTRQAAVTDGCQYIACRTRFAGRFVRPFAAAPDERIEPNGRAIEYRLINIFRYASDGRLAEEWAQYDAGAFKAQLRRRDRGQ